MKARNTESSTTSQKSPSHYHHFMDNLECVIIKSPGAHYSVVFCQVIYMQYALVRNDGYATFKELELEQ